MIAFLVGTLFGAGCILGLAAWLGSRDKPQATKTQHHGISAVGLGGSAVTMEAVNKDLLERVLGELNKNRLFELPTRGDA